jgi:hypothetical protein
LVFESRPGARAAIREPQVAGDGVLGEDHDTDERTLKDVPERRVPALV